MNNFIIVTSNAANTLVIHDGVTLIYPFWKNISDADLIYHAGDANYPSLLTTSTDRPGCRFAVIDKRQIATLPVHAARDVFARIGRVVQAAVRFPVRLPSSWQEYHYKALLSFYAAPVAYDSYRWIAQVDSVQGAVYFLRISEPQEKIRLEEYPISSLPTLRSYVDTIASNLVGEEQNQSSSFIEQSDFDAIGSSAISRTWNFETWKTKLTDKQKQVLDTDAGVRIVGPAGSGKTLTLCLKALQDARSNSQSRILFVTHSWAMAERADETVSTLNGGHPWHEITVMPLLEMLRDVIGKSYVSSIRILGDDSTEGRKLQLGLIAEKISNLLDGDRALLEMHSLSTHIRMALDSDSQNILRFDLIENLYLEINGFLLSEGIVPGDSIKEERYLSQERSNDLPPFPTRGDRMFVLLIYKAFLKQLTEWGYITTDQLVSDAIKILETFSWRITRETAGYDKIFVDELQLFDAQERFAITLLATSPESVTLVTAEDPSQGLFSAISPSWRQGIPSRGELKYITFDGVHRFSHRILEFVRYIYLSFQLNLEAIITENTVHCDDLSKKPSLYIRNNMSMAMAEIISLVQTTLACMSPEDRLAIICLDSCSQIISDNLKRAQISPIITLESLDDTSRLTYSKKSIIVGEWRFLGGTQFSHVIVVDGTVSAAQSPFSYIRSKTALYVATSRASKFLSMVFWGDVPDIVRSAQEKNIIDLC